MNDYVRRKEEEEETGEGTRVEERGERVEGVRGVGRRGRGRGT
jgi:hypothetical protein